MGEMTTRTDLDAARSFAQTERFAIALRLATVLHGCAGLRFSLTEGKRNDELVRLESSLGGFGKICGVIKLGQKTAAQDPMVSTFLPLGSVLAHAGHGSSSHAGRRNDRTEWRGRASWSAAVAWA